MSRSSWKCTYIHSDFYSQYQNGINGEEIILVNRNTMLTEDMLGLKISVYNGLRFFSFIVDSDKLGYKVGEFAPTRKKPIQKKKRNKWDKKLTL